MAHLYMYTHNMYIHVLTVVQNCTRVKVFAHNVGGEAREMNSTGRDRGLEANIELSRLVWQIA